MWVLLVILFTHSNFTHYNVGLVTTQEFTSKEKCERAVMMINSQLVSHDIGSPIRVISATCIQK
jgi:hypothetical protein